MTGPTDDLIGFQTPSGNIHCLGDRRHLRCDIIDFTWTPPPQPASCEFDWGNAIGIDSDGPNFVGISDSVIDRERPVLPYGNTLQFGPYRCESRTDGVRCGADHGFFVSKSRYELF